MSTTPNPTSAALKEQPQRLSDIHTTHLDTLETILTDIDELWDIVVTENDRELHLVTSAQAEQWRLVKDQITGQLNRARANLDEDTDEARTTAANVLLAIADQLAQHEHKNLAPSETGLFTKLLNRLRSILPGRRR